MVIGFLKVCVALDITHLCNRISLELEDRASRISGYDDAIALRNEAERYRTQEWRYRALASTHACRLDAVSLCALKDRQAELRDIYEHEQLHALYDRASAMFSKQHLRPGRNQ